MKKCILPILITLALPNTGFSWGGLSKSSLDKRGNQSSAVQGQGPVGSSAPTQNNPPPTVTDTAPPPNPPVVGTPTYVGPGQPPQGWPNLGEKKDCIRSCSATIHIESPGGAIGPQAISVGSDTLKNVPYSVCVGSAIPFGIEQSKTICEKSPSSDGAYYFRCQVHWGGQTISNLQSMTIECN